MHIIHHVKFFEILSNNKIPFSENRNGIFFTMNKWNNNIINKIKAHIEYIARQEHNLKKTEQLKENFHKEFFKDNKDKNIQYAS